VYKDEGIGRDWAIFRVAGSLGTKSPQDKYGYFKIEQTKAKRELVVRGYGLDDDPAGRPPLLRNEDSQTQQQHFGKLGSTSVLSKTRASVKHGVDTRGGNSGGPIVYAEKEDTAIAIHTHGDCTKGGKNSNSGTSFLNQELWSAILTAKDNH
jgi:hypothetical protein